MQNSMHVVQDGEAALAFLRSQGKYIGAPSPDMILLDIALPKMDGIEVLAEIRKDEKLRDMPVVILTASAMDEQIFREFNIPVDCYILKPLTLDRYLEAVRCFPNLGLSIVKIATSSG